MDYNNSKLQEYLKGRQVANPLILATWERLQKMGVLNGLSDDEVLERVVSVVEEIMK